MDPTVKKRDSGKCDIDMLLQLTMIFFLPPLKLFQPTVDNQHDLKVVWIDDMLDDDYSGVRLATK